MFKHVVLIAAAALAACGSKSAPQPTTPGDPPVAKTAAKPTDTPAAAPDDPMADRSPSKPADKPADKPATPKADPKADAMAAEMAAYEKAKPVFGKYCSTCHTKDGKKATKKKLDHMTMDTYPFGGEHTASIGNTIAVQLGLGDDKAKMPFDKPGSVKGDDLALIKAWIEAWRAAGKAGVHPAEEDKD